MKKPEEIKKGLECCFGNDERRICEECPYAVYEAGVFGDYVCSDFDAVGTDVLSLIQQLEAQVPRWIPVEDTEHKPMHGKDYLCVCTLKDYLDERWLQVLRWYADENGNGYVQRPHFTDEGCCGMLVTHWSEKPELPSLPEAPKEAT